MALEPGHEPRDPIREASDLGERGVERQQVSSSRP